MGELLSRTWPFLLPALLPILALLHVPLAGRRGRTVWALLLGVVAVGFLVDIAVVDHSGSDTVQVKNMFPRGPDEKTHAWVVDEVTAPHWQWHVVVSIWFGVIAAYSWLVRNRAPAAPQPIARAVIVFVSVLAARLALEKTAAHEEVVWAVGVNWAMLVIALFFGWYCGSRGYSFGRLALQLLIANAICRAILVTVGFFATTGARGTHLDVGKITDFNSPVGPEVVFAEPPDLVDRWMRLLLVPQTIFVVMFTIVGLLLGALPWHLARRRMAPAAATPALPPPA